MPPSPHFSVVIPVHNEAGFLPEALERLRAELAGVRAEAEVLLVENGSTDDTLEVARELAGQDPRLRILSLDTPDYGAAMRAGFLAGEGAWLVNFDIDYFSGAFLRQVLGLQGSADLVLASKLAPGSRDHRSPLRRAGTRVFNLLLRLLFASRVSDTHGMKAVRREVAAQLVPRVGATRDLFDTELVLRAERGGWRIVEVPAVVEELRAARSGLLGRVPRTLAGLLQLRRRLSSERRKTTSR